MITTGLKQILEAAKALSGAIRRTVLEEWEDVSERTGARVFFKLENLQVTNSFKIRGALNKIQSLTQKEREKGVICASAGNHAQGVALACRRYGISALIVVPENAPITKIEATRRHGAMVRTMGRDYDEAEAIAGELAQETGRTFVHAFEDNLVVAGQGTVGLELLQELPDVDIVLVPAGGGGLIGGVAAACKAVNPKIRVYGVQSEASPPWYYSFQAGRVVEVPIRESVAEGLAGSITEPTFEYVSRLVDGFLLVTEEAIWKAMGYALLQHHLVLEGSAAVSIAAVLGEDFDMEGKRVAAILTGGNVDLARIKEVLERT